MEEWKETQSKSLPLAEYDPGIAPGNHRTSCDEDESIIMMRVMIIFFLWCIYKELGEFVTTVSASLQQKYSICPKKIILYILKNSLK